MNRDSKTDQHPPPERRRRWLRRLVFLLALAGLGALSLWVARDVPRRWVEGRLAAMLDADVRLERLEIDSLRHFVLRGVEVERVRWDARIDRIRIERFDVEASLSDALGGRFERFVVDGLDVQLVPAAQEAEPPPPSELLVEAIEIRRARLAARSGARETLVEFRAVLANWGREPTGRASLGAERFDPWPLMQVLGGPDTAVPFGGSAAAPEADARAEMLRVEVSWTGGPEPLRVDADAGRLLVRLGDRRVELSGPSVVVTGAHDVEQGLLRLRVLPGLSGIEAAELAAELDDETLALRSGRAHLQGVEIATLLDTAAALPGGWKASGRSDLRVSTEEGRVFAYELDTRLDALELPLEGGAVTGADIRATLRGSWDSSDERADARALAYELDATLGALRFASGSSELSASGSRITSRGALDARGKGRIEARVVLRGGAGRHEGVSLPATVFPLAASLDGVLSLAGPPSFEGAGEVSSSLFGRLRNRGRTFIEEDRVLAGWTWSWSDAPALPELRRTAAELGWGGLPEELDVGGRPGARGSLKGAITDPRVGAELSVEELELSFAPGAANEPDSTWKLERARARIDVSREAGAGGRIELDRLELEGRIVPGAGPSAPAPGPRGVTLIAAGWTDASRGELHVGDARLEIEDLGAVSIEGRVDAEQGLSLRARSESVELPRIRELARPWFEDPAPDYALRGSVASRLDLRATPAGDWETQGELDLVGVGFGSLDGARVLEGGEAHWDFSLSSLGEGGIEGRATGTLTGPVALWGTLFGDFSQLSSTLELNARREADRWESSLDWRLPHGATVAGRLAADARPGHYDYALSVDLADLGGFLEHYVQGPFEGSVESLDALGAAGRVRVDLAGELDETRRGIQGLVQVSDASFTGVGETIAIEGLDLSLPISLNWEEDQAGSPALVAGPERAGSLACRRLRLGGLDVPPIDTALTVTGDTIRLDRPLDLPLLEGRVELQQVALAEWSRPSRDLRFALRLENLKLDALSRALDAFPLEGTLSGTFPAVRLTPSRLQLEGGGTIQVFGGAVEIFDISGRDVLSRFPKLRFSAKIDRIHLLDMTRALDFGEVYGVVSGEIRDCELFGGVPVRCEASIGSVKAKGVSRKISVKAVRNISIIGSGSRVGMLDRGLQRFLDTYTYSRLGFTMKLDSDRFLLRGTERRGDSELFVKGRLPFRIDIVNVSPGQAVSFQTMMGRLRNLQVGAPSRTPGKATPPRER